MTTTDLSQCKNCIHHYTYNGKDMCKQVGDDFYLQWKVEDCPYHTTITSAIKISDEIYRLRAENAELRARLENAVELKVNVGDMIYMPWTWNGISGIAGVIVREIQIVDDGVKHYITNFTTDDLAFASHYKFGKFQEDYFGKMIFTTPEAAAERLKELKENEK